MKKHLLVFTLVFATHVQAASIDDCNKAVSAGDYAKAQQLANAYIQTNIASRPGYLCLAKAYSGLEQHTQALEALVAADNQSATPLERIVTTLLIGNKNKDLKKFPEALQKLQSALDLASKEHSAYFEMQSLISIGELHESSGENEKAIGLYERALKLAANDNERANCNSLLAHVYSAIQKHDQAISYQLKAALLEERSGDFDHYVNAHLELVRIYILADAYTEAAKYLNKTMEVIVLNKDRYWEAKAYHFFSQLKKRLGESAAAAEYSQRAVSIAREIGADDLLSMFQVRETKSND